MNPPESQGPEYDRGYSDGYSARSVEALIVSLKEAQYFTQEDWQYLSESCRKLPDNVQGLLKIKQ